MLCTPNGSERIQPNLLACVVSSTEVNTPENARFYLLYECNHRKCHLKKSLLQNYVPWFSRFNDFATHLSPFHTFLCTVWDFIVTIVVLSFLFTHTHMLKMNTVWAEQQTNIKIFLCSKSSGLFVELARASRFVFSSLICRWFIRRLPALHEMKCVAAIHLCCIVQFMLSDIRLIIMS